MNGPIRANRGEVIRTFSFQNLATCCATLTTDGSEWLGLMAQPETLRIAPRDFRSMPTDALEAVVARDARRTRFVPEYLEVIHDRTTLGESQDVVLQDAALAASSRAR